MNPSILRATLAAAKDGPGVGRSHNFKLAASLYDPRGNLIKTRTNILKTHPALVPFFKYPYLHAEARTILSHGIENCRDLNLLVVRTLKDGRASMAKPCSCCMGLIRHVGIGVVTYTGWYGELIDDLIDY